MANLNNILESIVEAKRERVAADKLEKPEFNGVEADAHGNLVTEFGMTRLPDFAFENALKNAGLSYICEVKKASPSKGVLVEDFEPVAIAQEYERAGASAISILTEKDYFLGEDEYLTDIRGAVGLPLLRKDFIIDPYQIEQSFQYGADAILLIVSILEAGQLREFLALADSFGMSAIVEVHDEAELQIALEAGARIIGVNNRDLKTFTVDIQNSIRLKKLAPSEVIFVAESGIKSRADIEELENNQIDAVLIGETLMKSSNKERVLDMLRGYECLSPRSAD